MNKPENLFVDQPAEQRAALIAEIATKQQIEKVKRQYTEDEKQQMKDFVTDESISVMEQTAEFKAIKKEFDSAIKKYKDSIIDALKRYKKGFSENDEPVFLIEDQDSGVMNIFDANGEYLYTRKLFPDERQTTILSIKTGTND
jgi:hypothetical protein